MTTIYPSKIDTDVQLPMVSDGVSEISNISINAMRDAIIAIEKTIGENPQGSTANLVSRISQAINDDGTLKASALIAAGLISLPITNAQISNSAGISESKIDLDVATQLLQDQVSSNDVDIANLQQSISTLLNNFNLHISGTAFKHDAFDILLDKAYPSSTPPAFVGLTGSEVGSALIEINNNFRTHINASKIGAHKASNISVDGTNFITISPLVDDVQEALEQLDASRNLEMVEHRDDMHANGFDNWANDTSGFNRSKPLFPLDGTTFSASVSVSHKTKVKFTGTNVASYRVKQGDYVVIADGYGKGAYIIDDVGPRGLISSKPILLNDEVELTTPVSGVDIIPGAIVNAQLFAAGSVANLHTNVAPTIYQSSALDSVQLARPNSAKVVSLGATPNLMTSGLTLAIEAGLDVGSRTISINNLDFDRNGALASGVRPTVATIVDRVNSVLKANNFPVGAYAIGDEFMLAHNWDGSSNYYLKVLSTGTANVILGFDGYGADVVDKIIYPTQTAKFYVGGRDFNKFAPILLAPASASTTTISFTGLDPISKGIRPGHLVHVKNHPSANNNGTYLITGVASNSITVHKSIATANVNVEIIHDAVPLAELAGSGLQQIIETFVDTFSKNGYNLRASCESINGLSLIDVSDNSLPGSYKLFSQTVSGGKNIFISLNSVNGITQFVPTGFVGKLQIYFPSNIENISVQINGSLGNSAVGGAALNIYDHVNEEDVLEVCSVRSDGGSVLSSIVDKRLFGSIGLDELREDVIQAYVETPIAELRSNGVVRGFDIVSINAIDVAYPSNSLAVIRGGSAYVGGVRVSIPTKAVVFPIPAASTTYFICLNTYGDFVVIDQNDYTMSQIISGIAGTYALIAMVNHSGASGTSALSSNKDLRFFINAIDNKFDLILDASSNVVGSFATIEAALAYANNYPLSEKFRIKVVSNTLVDLTIPTGSRELTVEIDGQLRNVIIQENARLTSSSISGRLTPHISGTLLIDSTVDFFEAEGISIAGVATIATPSASQTHFTRCKFSSDVIVTSAGYDNKFDNCLFADTSSGISDSGDAHLTVINCVFQKGIVSTVKSSPSSTVSVVDTKFSSTTGGIGSFIGGFVTITGCSFIGMSGTLVVENGLITNCFFSEMTMSSAPLISVQASDTANQCVVINGNVFGNISMTGANGKFISTVYNVSLPGWARVENCVFENINLSVNAAMVCCQEFINNNARGKSGIGNSIITSADFIGNIGFQVYDGNNYSLLPRNILNNTFAQNTFGFNVRIQYTGNSKDSFTNIIGNKFYISSSQNGILLATESSIGPVWSPRIQIKDNYFSPDVGTISGSAYGINFGTTGSLAIGGQTDRSMLVEGNVFRNITAFYSDANLFGLHVVNNRFDNSSFAVESAGSLLFSDNKLINGTIVTFQGPSNVSEVSIFGNHAEGTSSGKLSIEFGSLQNSILSDNVCDINFAADLTNCAVSGNFGSLTVGSGVIFSKVICSNNNLVLDSSSSLVRWQTSTLSDNVLSSSGLITFKLSDTSDTETTISGNVIDNSLSITSDSTITQLLLADNFYVGNSTGTITIPVPLNNSFINRNFNFAIVAGSTLTNSSISSNMAPSSNVTLIGNITNSDVSNNVINNIVCISKNLNSLIVQSNQIFGTISLSDSSAHASLLVDKFITDCAIANNYLHTGSINIGNAETLAAATQFVASNNTITGNQLTTGGINIFGFATATATSKKVFNNNRITGNTIKSLNMFGGLKYDSGINDSIANNTISSNFIDGTVAISGASSSNTGISGLDFSNNYISSSLTYTNLPYNGLEFSNSIFGAAVLVDLQTTVSLSSLFTNLSIERNTFKSSVTIQLNGTPIISYLAGVVFSENYCGANNVFIIPRPASSNALYIEDLAFENNILRAVSFADTRSSSTKGQINRASINGNKFAGSLGGSPASPGIFFESSNATSVSNMSVNHCNISNNFGNESTNVLLDVKTAGNVAGSNLNFTFCNISGNTSFSISPEVNTGNGQIAFTDCTVISNTRLNIFGSGTKSGGIVDWDNSSFIGNKITSISATVINMRYANCIVDSNQVVGDAILAISSGSINSNVFGGSLTITTNFSGEINNNSILIQLILQSTFDGLFSGNRIQGFNKSDFAIQIADTFTGNFIDNLVVSLSTIGTQPTDGVQLNGSFKGIFSGNIIRGNVLFSGSFWRGVCSTNYLYVSTMNFNPSGTFEGLVGNISNNYIESSGNMIFNDAAFPNTISGANQLKIIGNTVAGKIDTQNSYSTNFDSATFFWGNSCGVPAVNLTIVGTNATNLSTANNVTSTGSGKIAN